MHTFRHTSQFIIPLLCSIMLCTVTHTIHLSAPLIMLPTFLECQTVGSARLSGAGCKEFCCTRLCYAVNVVTTVSKHVIPGHRKAVCTVTSWLV